MAISEQRKAKMADVLILVGNEYLRAREIHPDMVSTHEGFAVLLEEVDELWDEVKKRDGTPEARRKEAIQIAAMAVAFVLEVA